MVQAYKRTLDEAHYSLLLFYPFSQRSEEFNLL